MQLLNELAVSSIVNSQTYYSETKYFQIGETLLREHMNITNQIITIFGGYRTVTYTIHVLSHHGTYDSDLLSAEAVTRHKLRGRAPRMQSNDAEDDRKHRNMPNFRL